MGNAGVLLTRCLYEKKGKAKTFKIVDAGMNDFIRPALYEGHHEIVPVVQSGPVTTVKTDVVGPVCETGDFFCQDRDLPDFAEGELLALMSSGAYGAVMGSTYNSRPLPPKFSSMATKRPSFASAKPSTTSSLKKFSNREVALTGNPRGQVGASPKPTSVMTMSSR